MQKNLTKIEIEDLPILLGCKPSENIVRGSSNSIWATPNLILTHEFMDKITKSVEEGLAYMECCEKDYGNLIEKQVEKKDKIAKEYVSKASESIGFLIDRINELDSIDEQLYHEVEGVVTEQIDTLLYDEYVAKKVLDTMRYDMETFKHSACVTIISLLFANFLNNHKKFSFDFDLDIVGQGALLHDVGKTEIPYETLKEKGRLSDEQYDQIRQHPDHGKHLLEDLNIKKSNTIPAKVIEIVHGHHKKPSGNKGYPKLKIDEIIPDVVLLVAQVDMYEALRASRCYKTGWDLEKTIDTFEEDAKAGIIDPRMFNMFKMFLRECTAEGDKYFNSHKYSN